MLASAGPTAPHEPTRPWLDHRHIMATCGVFLCYAVVSAVLAGGRDKVWAIWAACGYAAALLILWRSRSRTAALLVCVAVAVVAPLLWLSVAYRLEDGMVVIERSATLLLHHGSPYLSSQQVTSWLSYNPYLPVMTVFGLPSAFGLGGLAGNSGVWLAVGTVVPLAAAFWVAVPHRGCPPCRRDALLATALAVASPVIGLNLAVITTDPPVLALMLLSLALAARPPSPAARPPSASPLASVSGVARRSRRFVMSAVSSSAVTEAISSGAVMGVACDMKSTAWLAVPVLGAMFASRDGARAAVRFVAAAVATAVVLIAVLAPAALIKPAAMIQNSVLFPLGLTHDKTPAGSLLPGHLLTALGTAGHVVSVGLLLAAGLGIAISLVIRPPRDVPAACWRLAIGLALMFLLGPDVRFGYFIYPLGLIGWVALTTTSPRTPEIQRTPGPDGLVQDAVEDR
jgi:hypothetical protein